MQNVSQGEAQKKFRNMARKKVKLQWIINDTARRTTYKKRVKSLMKKAKELSVLCGVEACSVVYSPYDPLPEVWPSPVVAASVIGEFKSLPENVQTNKKLDQENYTRQRLVKSNDQLVKQQKKNRKMEMENLMNQCLTGGNMLQHELNIKQCSDLIWAIDDRLKAIRHQMEINLRHPPPQPGSAAALAAVPVAGKTALEAALENQMLMETAPHLGDSVGYPGRSQEM